MCRGKKILGPNGIASAPKENGEVGSQVQSNGIYLKGKGFQMVKIRSNWVHQILGAFPDHQKLECQRRL